MCGKEALLMLGRELAHGTKASLLDSVVVAIVPIFNADGNERFAKDNRPHQLGPAPRHQLAEEAYALRDDEPGSRIEGAGPVELSVEARLRCRGIVPVADGQRVDERLGRWWRWVAREALRPSCFALDTFVRSQGRQAESLIHTSRIQGANRISDTYVRS